MDKDPNQLLYFLSALNQEHFKLSHALYMIEVVRQKIQVRGYQHFDKEDIKAELGKLQGSIQAIHDKLNIIADTLKAL